MSEPTPAGQPPAPPADPTATEPKKDAAPAEPPKEPAKEPPKEPAQPVIPEKYEFKLPEGTPLNESVLSAIQPVFKDLKLTQESAQTLVSKVSEIFSANFASQVSEWETQAKADKDFGGAKFEANVAIAQKAIARFGSPELKAYLDQTGLGSHPEMLKFAHAIGKAISEDVVPPPKNPPARTAKDLYPHPSSQAVLT